MNAIPRRFPQSRSTQLASMVCARRCRGGKRRGSRASWTAHVGLKEQTGSAASHVSRLAREEMENDLGLVGDRLRAPERCQQWKKQPRAG